MQSSKQCWTKQLLNTSKNFRTSQGVSPTTQLLLCSASGIRSPIQHFCCYPETLYSDTTFKMNNKQRTFLMICGKDANGEIRIFLCIYHDAKSNIDQQEA
jgi:hypothetical protein